LRVWRKQRALVVQDLVPSVPKRLPPDTRVYPSGLPTIALPRDWTAPPLAATEGLGGRPTTAARVALEGLGRLLHLSAGVVRFRARRPSPAGVWRFRATGSAGGLFPLEVYVAAHGARGLDDGVRWHEDASPALDVSRTFETGARQKLYGTARAADTSRRLQCLACK
jgi:hypothetical protein